MHSSKSASARRRFLAAAVMAFLVFGGRVTAAPGVGSSERIPREIDYWPLGDRKVIRIGLTSVPESHRSTGVALQQDGAGAPQKAPIITPVGKTGYVMDQAGNVSLPLGANMRLLGVGTGGTGLVNPFGSEGMTRETTAPVLGSRIGH